MGAQQSSVLAAHCNAVGQPNDLRARSMPARKGALPALGYARDMVQLISHTRQMRERGRSEDMEAYSKRLQSTASTTQSNIMAPDDAKELILGPCGPSVNSASTLHLRALREACQNVSDIVNSACQNPLKQAKRLSPSVLQEFEFAVLDTGPLQRICSDTSSLLQWQKDMEALLARPHIRAADGQSAIRAHTQIMCACILKLSQTGILSAAHIPVDSIVQHQMDMQDHVNTLWQHVAASARAAASFMNEMSSA